MSGTCISLDTSSSEASDDEALSLHSDGECDGLSPGPSKRRKATAGAAVYKTRFKNEWTKTWPFICGVPGNIYKFRCTICSRDISCSHMGKADVERHIGKEMHNANVKSAHSQRKLQFVPVSDPITDKVTRAEVKVATMLAQHNIPIALSDELTPLFRDIFPDSEIAKRYASRQTKTACLINRAIAPFFCQKLVTTMKTTPFSVAIDGSSDTGKEKMNPLTIRTYDDSRGIVHTQFLDMCMSSDATAEGIFSKMQEALDKHEISWNNCVGISLDNTSVNMGCHNSIRTRVVGANPAAYILGCPCHIVHNIASKANEAFEQVSHFNVEEMVVDLFYWFDKSTKRKANLDRYCSFCDTNYREIVKHVSTRWLSLGRAVDRALQQYEALKSYFGSQSESVSRFARLQVMFSAPLTELYLLFYQAALQVFLHFNMFLQREDPLIPIIHKQIASFLTKLATKFLLVSTIKAAKGDFCSMPYKDSAKQLSDDDIFIGLITRQRLNKLFREGDLSPTEKSKFLKSVRAFYIRAMEYSIANLPLNDDLLRNAAFVHIPSREDARFTQVEYFVSRFNHLLPYHSPQELEQLSEEFSMYQLIEDNEIPQGIWDTATVKEDDGKCYYRMDILWHFLSTLKMPDGSHCFGKLTKVAKLVLVIPHSNAEEERVFSMVRKNKTAFRPSLDPKGTLSSLLTIKLANTEPAHRFEPPKEVLKGAKSATTEYILKRSPL